MTRDRRAAIGERGRAAVAACAAVLAVMGAVTIGAQMASRPPSAPAADSDAPTSPLMRQTQAQALAKSEGCLKCHKGIEPMHVSAAVRLACTDCHGGNASASTKEGAHVKPLHPEVWTSSANPVRSYTALLKESPEFVKFVNPGDLLQAVR